MCHCLIILPPQRHHLLHARQVALEHRHGAHPARHARHGGRRQGFSAHRDHTADARPRRHVRTYQASGGVGGHAGQGGQSAAAPGRRCDWHEWDDRRSADEWRRSIADAIAGLDIIYI